ncbi:MAG: hypothetical protein R3B09_33020 [Nannocystaceae bacterium]
MGEEDDLAEGVGDADEALTPGRREGPPPGVEPDHHRRVGPWRDLPVVVAREQVLEVAEGDDRDRLVGRDVERPGAALVAAGEAGLVAARP